MQPTLQRAWSNLVDYYLKCLEIEQTQTLGVTHQQNHALLCYLTDTMISNGAERAEIRHPSDRVWLFCYNASNSSFPVSCPVMACHQHCPPEMSCRCGRALGISENLV